MKALVVSGQQVRYSQNHTAPRSEAGVAVVCPTLSGICRTDLEIIRGYSGFAGVLGHEFVGRVVECDQSEWVGQRVVGEINWACGACPWCREGGTPLHCPRRKALGIRGWDGAFAERLAMPVANLHRVPEALTDEQAVFTEPLASAYSLVDSLDLKGGERLLGIGDGRLGLLIAQVLRRLPVEVTWCGRHDEKLRLLQDWGITTCRVDNLPSEQWEVVVEASGGPSGFLLAQSRLKPRGTLALKTTTHLPRELDLNALVVNEWKVVGSRCGPFSEALNALRAHHVQVEPLISQVFALEQGVEALERAAQPGVLKVLLRHETPA